MALAVGRGVGRAGKNGQQPSWECLGVEEAFGKGDQKRPERLTEEFRERWLTKLQTAKWQPLDQGEDHCFKAAYTKLTFSWMMNLMDADPDLDLTTCWKSFSIAHCSTCVNQAVGAITPETVNACWWNLGKECVHDFKGFPNIVSEMKDIVQRTTQVGSDGFVDLIQEEVEDVVEDQQVLTVEELEELVRSSSEWAWGW